MTRDERKALEAKLLRMVEAGDLTFVEASMLFDKATRQEAVTLLKGMERCVPGF